MQYNVSSPQTRFNIFLHYFLQKFTANVFQFGEIILHIIATGWKMLMDREKIKEEENSEMIWYERQKETKLCFLLVESLSDVLFNEHANPCTHASNSCSAPSKRGIPSWHTDIRPLGPSKLFCFFAAVAIVSPIYWWAKNTIISKINATLSQNNEQINNNQVVFLYCICTVYTQRVTFVVYMYTNNWQSCFRLGF